MTNWYAYLPFQRRQPDALKLCDPGPEQLTSVTAEQTMATTPTAVTDRERFDAITDALKIIQDARFATAFVSPAAWNFLWRVVERLKLQQELAFNAAVGADEQMDT